MLSPLRARGVAKLPPQYLAGGGSHHSTAGRYLYRTSVKGTAGGGAALSGKARRAAPPPAVPCFFSVWWYSFFTVLWYSFFYYTMVSSPLRAALAEGRGVGGWGQGPRTGRHAPVW